LTKTRVPGQKKKKARVRVIQGERERERERRHLVVEDLAGKGRNRCSAQMTKLTGGGYTGVRLRKLG
jgi:hypothetical protein